jgi:5'-nucleotidase
MSTTIPDRHLVGVNSDARRHGPAIELSSGAKLRLQDPDPELLTIEVIASSLSKLCRWTGHTSKFFSVAQHSVLVSRIVPEEIALDGLLHDASECVVGDLSRPMKLLLGRNAFIGIEKRVHRVIAERYGTSFPHDPRIKEADDISLAMEIAISCRQLPTPITGERSCPTHSRSH